jgi:MYXO-CTERM domain-containing protein
MRNSSLSRVMALMALVGVIACVADPSHEAKATPPSPLVSPPFEPSAIVQRAARSFRREGGALVAGGGSWAVTLRDGRVALRTRRAGSEFALRTHAVELGENRVQPGLVPRLTDDGQIHLATDGVTERLRMLDQGLEQSWEFSRPPAAGGIEVAVAVGGLEFERMDGQGLHFRGTRGGGVLYGHGTWIDASGARLPVLASYTAGEIRLRIPAEIVQAARYPAVLDPVVTPETDIGNPNYVTAGQAQPYPAVAFSGTNYLVVWSDERMTYPGEMFAQRLYGARVSAEGKLLDPGGLDLDPNGKMVHPGKVAVASNGKNFLVGWEDDPSNSAQQHVHVERVGLDGSLLDGGIDLTPSGVGARSPRIASDGDSYLVVWQEGGDPDYHTKAARIAGDGTVTIPATAIDASTEVQMVPQVAFGGGVYLVTYQTQNWQIGARVIPGSGPIAAGNALILSPSLNYTPAVAFDGSNFLVVWNGGVGISAARVSPAGAKLDATPIQICDAVDVQMEPAVGSNGDGFLVAWRDCRTEQDCAHYGDLYAARVGGNGVVKEPNGFLVAGGSYQQQSPNIACPAGGECLLVFVYGGRGGPFAARIGPATVVPDAGAPVLELSTQAGPQSSPQIASDGNDFFAAWLEQTGDLDQPVLGGRFSSTGQRLDTGGLLLTDAHLQAGSVVLGSDGSGYLAAWSWYGMDTNDDILGSRISRAGQVLDRAMTIQQTKDYDNGQVIACNPGVCLVAWNASAGTVLARRLTSTGGVVDSSPISISLGGDSYQTDLSLAADGTNFLLSWFVGQSAANEQWMGLRLGPDGKLLDGNRLALSPPGVRVVSPKVKFGGGVYLAVWAKSYDSDGGAYVNRLSAQRISAGGQLLDTTPITLADATSQPTYPDLAWMGSSFLVIWDRLGSTSWDLVGRRVRSDGSLIDTDPFLIADDPKASEGPASMASNGKGVALVGYERFDSSSVYGSRRVRFRLVTSLPDCTACSSSSECESGLCSSGICTSTRCSVDASVIDAPRDAITFSIDAPLDTIAPQLDTITPLLDAITPPLDAITVRDTGTESGRESGPERGPPDLGADQADNASPDTELIADAPQDEHAGPDLAGPIDARPPLADAGSDAAIDTTQPQPDSSRLDAGRDAAASAGSRGCQCSIGATSQGGSPALPALGLILLVGLLVRQPRRQVGKGKRPRAESRPVSKSIAVVMRPRVGSSSTSRRGETGRRPCPEHASCWSPQPAPRSAAHQGPDESAPDGSRP